VSLVRRRRGRGDESGIALLIVLLTITLLMIVVVEFTDSAQVETHLALSARNALQASYLARSGINVAEALVSVDGMISPGTDSASDFWARPYPPLPIGDGTAVFRVRDEARFLNLNDMLSGGSLRPERVDVFRRLFTVLGVDPRILMAIIDWIDADSNAIVSPPGAEQPYYLGVRPPTIVRNGPLLTLRELLLVRGVTPTVLARLEGFVTALPPNALKVNINTAPAEVLYALSDGMLADPGVVDRLIATRDTAPFTAPSEALSNVTGLEQALGGGKDFLDTNSAYFRLEGVGEVDEVRRGIIEVVKRDGRSVKRVTWTPSNANLALTSLPPSDFLATLPVFGDR
jgi:general secretion pathway protein K